VLLSLTEYARGKDIFPRALSCPHARPGTFSPNTNFRLKAHSRYRAQSLVIAGSW